MENTNVLFDRKRLVRLIVPLIVEHALNTAGIVFPVLPALKANSIPLKVL